jgi:hypothetical protein
LRFTSRFATATALTTSVLSPSAAQTTSSVLQSLPADVQKDIEETRASCRSIDEIKDKVTSGDEGLTQFTLRGRQAVLIDPVILCGECYHGYSCDNRGERSVRVYALFGSAWPICSN